MRKSAGGGERAVNDEFVDERMASERVCVYMCG